MNLFKVPTIVEGNLSPDFLQGKLKATQLKALEALVENQSHGELVNHIQKNEDLWMAFINTESPEDEIPIGWESHQQQDNTKITWSDDQQFVPKFNKFVENLNILRVLRPDRF